VVYEPVEPLAKFGADGARLLTTLLDARVAAGTLRDWAPGAFADFARARALHAIGTRGYAWTEIDFPEDYQRAVTEILPAIESVGDGHIGHRKRRREMRRELRMTTDPRYQAHDRAAAGGSAVTATAE